MESLKTSTLVTITSLVIGAILCIASVCVWVLRSDFGAGGAAFLGAGIVLMGLSVFAKANLKAGPIQFDFETQTKRFEGITNTGENLELLIRETLESSLKGAGETVSEEISTPDEITENVLSELRNKAFLTIDTRTYLSDIGKTVNVQYGEFESIGLLLRYIWFLMEGALPGHSYGIEWVLKDLDSGKHFTEIGSRYARKHLGSEWDERDLGQVGIFPGMRIGVIHPNLPNKALQSDAATPRR